MGVALANKSVQVQKKGKRKMHPNSLANLRPKPFPPGVSGNPGGKPQGEHSPTASMRRVMATKAGEKFVPKTNADVFAQAWFINASKGNGTALREALGRVDGPLVEKREVTGADGAPLQIDIQIKQAADELRRILDKRIESAETARAEGDAV